MDRSLLSQHGLETAVGKNSMLTEVRLEPTEMNSETR
jgi:hypothetical protein